MQKLNISADLSVPLDVASQAVAILGIRGAGKTNTAMVFAEELLAKAQPMVYIDPTDGAWGLRSDFPVFIFGGTHGDLPLQETDGKVLAEFVVSEQVPVILSLRHLRKNAQRRFVTEFCEEIYHLKGKPENRTPLTVFIDEAPLFVPQKVLGETARTVGAVEDLIARGRNAGFGVVLISQRSATINKDVLTQCDTIITHRLTSPQDRKALSDWIEENATIEKQKEVLQSLATMPNGRAWVWSPRLDVMKQVQVRLRKTFDSSATPTRGERPAQPKRLEEIDLGKLKNKLAETVKKAEQDDPVLLRKRIAHLERNGTANPGLLDLAKRNGYEEGRQEFEQWRVQTLRELARRLSLVREQFDGFIRELEKESTTNALPAENPRNGMPKPPDRNSRTRDERSALGDNGAKASTARQIDAGGATLPKGERAILIALAQYPDGCMRDQLSVLTGYKRSSRDAYVQRLRERGLAESSGDIVGATVAGIDALGSDYQPLPTGADLLEHWLGRLPTGEAAILRLVAAKYPNPADREWLSEKSGYQRSSRDAYIQRLRSRKLVSPVGRGDVQASRDLFE